MALRRKVEKKGRRLCASVTCNFLLHSRMHGWNTAGSRVDPTRPLEDCHEVLPDPRFSRRRCRRCRVPFLSTHSSSRYAEPTLSCNKASKETFRFPANRRDSAIISNTRNTREFVSYKNFVHSVLCSCSWILEYTIISR